MTSEYEEELIRFYEWFYYAYRNEQKETVEQREAFQNLSTIQRRAWMAAVGKGE